MITTLRIRKIYKDKLALAIKWYSILSILNDFHWSPLEIELISYTAVEGNISSGGRKEKFCSLFSSTKNSLSNSICKMQKKGFLVKKDGKTVVHPQLKVECSHLLITLNLENEAT